MYVWPSTGLTVGGTREAHAAMVIVKLAIEADADPVVPVRISVWVPASVHTLVETCTCLEVLSQDIPF